MYDPNMRPPAPGQMQITSAAPNAMQGWRVGQVPGLPGGPSLPGIPQGPLSPGGFPANNNALIPPGYSRSQLPSFAELGATRTEGGSWRLPAGQFDVRGFLDALMGWRDQRPMGMGRDAMSDWRGAMPNWQDYRQVAPASVPPMSAPNIG